jgi:hypothetical protein
VCTLTLAWRLFEDPVVVAANRDEALDRPADPPGPFPGEPGVFAPRDREAGGTWIGYNDDGVFAGLTNRWVHVEGDDRRSRGQLVLDCLRAESAEAAVRGVERAVDADDYAGFDLVVADANAAFLCEWDGRFAVTPLSPGVHVVVNVGSALGGGGAVTDRFFVPERRPDLGAQQAENARRVREVLTPEPNEDAAAWLGRAADVLGDHEYGVCVHGDGGDPTAPPDGFGTRSSSLLRLGSDPWFAFADGPPCVTEYRTVIPPDEASEGQV